MSTVRCYWCGRFIPYADCEYVTENGARFHYVPDAYGQAEEEWWSCAKCVRNDEKTE